jgi:hypothetical protein
MATLDTSLLGEHDLGLKVLLEIGNERLRQVCEEGFTAEHDSYLRMGQLANMGAAYAQYASKHRAAETTSTAAYRRDNPEFWTGPYEWWKPKDIRADLVKAAALIMAEIEMIDRGIGL